MADQRSKNQTVARAMLIATATLAPSVVAGCSASAHIGGSSGSSGLSQSQLESDVASKYKAQTGNSVKVSCSGSLNAKVGATQQCQVSNEAGTSSKTATITVTSVSNGNVNFSMNFPPG